MAYSATSTANRGISPTSGRNLGSAAFVITPALLGAAAVGMPPHLANYARVEIHQVADISSVNPLLNKSIVLTNTAMDRELQTLARGAFDTLLAKQTDTEADIAAATMKNRTKLYVVL